MKLRPYQEKLINDIRSKMISGHKNVLAQLPTGGGKTVVAAKMIATAHSRDKVVWFICNRQELVDQTAKALYKFGIPFSYIANGYDCDQKKSVFVCSVQTLGRRLKSIYKKPDMIYWDECRMIASRTCSNVFWNNPQAYHIGLDATPTRLSGESLGEYFTSMVNGPSVRWLIDNGFLCDYKIFAPKVASFENIRTKMGDYDIKQLDDIMNEKKILGNAVKEYTKHANGLRNLVFCNSIMHSKNLCAEYQVAGISAADIDGTMKDSDRRTLLKKFEQGEIKVLTSVDLVTAGLDIPQIECVTLERATQSVALAKQMIGRGLRTHADKSKLIILDHVNMWTQHGLPDDEYEWTLEGKGRPTKKSEQSVRQCEKCYFVYVANRRDCPECGHSQEVKSRKVDMEHTDDELGELNIEAARMSSRREQGTAKTYEDLVELGKQRGYKRPHLWAKHVHNGRQAKKVSGI